MRVFKPTLLNSTFYFPPTAKIALATADAWLDDDNAGGLNQHQDAGNMEELGGKTDIYKDGGTDKQRQLADT